MSVWLTARIISTPSCVFTLSSSLRLGYTLLSLFCVGLPEDSMFIHSDLTKMGQHQEVTFLEMEKIRCTLPNPFRIYGFLPRPMYTSQCSHHHLLYRPLTILFIAPYSSISLVLHRLSFTSETLGKSSYPLVERVNLQALVYLHSIPIRTSELNRVC